MNKRILVIGVAFLLIVGSFSSCKVSSENGKDKLDVATDNIAKQIELINDTEFRDAAFGILNTEISDVNFKKSLKAENIIKIKEMSLGIKNSLLKTYPRIFNKKLGSNEFSISEYAGTYTWNNTTEEWDFEKNTSSIIINFPSYKNSSNDCKFEWSKYEEIKTNDGWYYPSVIYATLTQDKNQIAVVDVEVEYDLETEIPIDGKVIIGLGKIELKTDWEFKNNTLAINVLLKKGLSKINDISSELTFDNDKMNELISGEGVVKIHNIENSGGLKIAFYFDNVDDIDDCNDFNENIEIMISTLKNRRIGEVQCDDNNDCGFIIVFNDGTTESVCTYFEKLENEIENVLACIIHK